MRKSLTSKGVAVSSDARYQHESDGLVADKSKKRLLSRETSVAWSLHDANVSCAADRLTPQKYKLPWETGYAGMVISNKFPKLMHMVGEEPMQIGRSDFILGAASSSTTVNHIALLPKLPGHMRCLKLMNWHADADDLKRKALGLVRIMLESDFSATRVGKMMHDMAYNLSDEHLIRQLLEDTFAKKSPSTLYKRSRCFWKYFNWMKGFYSESLHLSEDRIYRYVCHLRESGAAPTSAKAFVESVNFFSHLLGFTTCNTDLVISARTKGVVHTMLLNKRPLDQARALTVQEVSGLEQLVVNPSSPTLGILAGFFLFCIMNCCRFNDAQYSARLDLDSTDGLTILHSGTYQHKTATSADKRTTLLPLVCLGNVFDMDSWASSWILLMETAGWPEERDYLLPAYSEYSGGWLQRRMTSGEGTLWLRECLAAAEIDIYEKEKLPTTHSCKTTLLSWLAKSGKFDVSERQIMGHHLDGPSVSALTYGRQNFIPVLTKVAVVLGKIKDGSFSPDAQPSRLVRDALLQMEEESARHEAILGLAPKVHDVEDSDDSASDVGDQEDVELDIAEIVPETERRLQPVFRPEQYEQHRLSGIRHLIADDTKFFCGRVRSYNYLPCEAGSTLGMPLCEQCRASRGGQAAQ